MIRWRNRGNKYGAVKTVVDGITFDSKAEARRYQELKLLQRGGKIIALKVHPVYPIPNGTLDGVDGHICNVELDFEYFRDDWVFEDVKGQDNALSRLKRKLVEAFYFLKVDVISAGSPASKKNASRPSQPNRQESPKRESK